MISLQNLDKKAPYPLQLAMAHEGHELGSHTREEAVALPDGSLGMRPKTVSFGASLHFGPSEKKDNLPDTMREDPGVVAAVKAGKIRVRTSP